jgi:hypothetical protein
MCIQIGVVEGLPFTPTPYKELDQKCLKTYTKFKFFDDSHIHRAYSTDPHGYKASINARHVIIPGLMGADKLIETLGSQKMEIEVHDRDLVSDSLVNDRSDAFGVASFGILS